MINICLGKIQMNAQTQAVVTLDSGIEEGVFLSICMLKINKILNDN